MCGRVQRLITISSIGILLAVGQAVATTITSTSYSAWTAGLTGSPTELNFSQIHPGTTYNTSSGITLNAIGNNSIGFGFTGPDNGSYSLVGYSYGNITSLKGGSDTSASIHIATPLGGDNALLLGLASTGSTPINLALSDGESFTITTSLFGLSISHPITWLTLTTTAGSAIIVDDFYYGSSSLPQDEASEGATMAMCGGGLLILFGSIRKKTKNRNT